MEGKQRSWKTIVVSLLREIDSDSADKSVDMEIRESRCSRCPGRGILKDVSEGESEIGDTFQGSKL